MGHFKGSSYANLMFENGIILTTITTTRTTTAPTTHTIITEKNHLCYFCLSTMVKVSQLFAGVKLWSNLISNPLVHITGVVAASRPHISS